VLLWAAACVASSQNVPATIRLTVASEQFRAHHLLTSGLCDGIPRYRHTRGSRVCLYRYTVMGRPRPIKSGPFAVANRVTVYRRNVDLIGRALHVTVYRYRHTRDPRVCSYRGIPSEIGEFQVLCVWNYSLARTVQRIVDNPEAPRRCGDTRRCERA